MTLDLRNYQQEMKRLLFYRDEEIAESPLWKGPVPPRLRVYRNNTRLNWADTLNFDFPLTRQQFDAKAWEDLRRRYFIKHPPAHWELNASMTPFISFLKAQRVPAYVKELADYEWHDLKVFIDRSVVKPGSGILNPTAVVRVYQHQLFYWVEEGAPAKEPPEQTPEVLVFFRDSQNACHIQEADPLMLMMMDHFRKRDARLDDLEPLRQKLLPQNTVPLQKVFETLRAAELLL